MTHGIFGIVTVDQIRDALVFVVTAKRASARDKPTSGCTSRRSGKLEKRRFFATDQVVDGQRILLVGIDLVSGYFSKEIDHLQCNGRKCSIAPNPTVKHKAFADVYVLGSGS